MLRTRNKRGSSRVLASGRSLKRLRLDHVQIPPGGNFSSAHSLGTLSVGTGDLESIDDGVGEEVEEEETGDVDSGSAGVERGGGESVASSWVASMGSAGNFRKRPIGTAGATAVQAASLKMLDEDEDDAATCSEMTTAALAPRRRRPHQQPARKRRAIGFTMPNHDNVGEFAPGQKSMLPPPPVKQPPDPLLVAARHAAGGWGASSAGESFVDDTRECCSSVSEEDRSLAEDEASISAISIGANTTVSALSGGIEPPCSSSGAGASSFDQLDGGARYHAAMKSNDPSMLVGPKTKSHHVNQRCEIHASAGGGYAPLNQILGKLHNERLSRLSTHRPHSRGQSSEGSGGGATYRSLPGNPPAAASCAVRNAGARNMMWSPSGQQQRPPMPPSSSPFAQERTPLCADDDAEMEEVANDNHRHYQHFGKEGSHGGGYDGAGLYFGGKRGRGDSLGTLSNGGKSASASLGSDVAVVASASEMAKGSNPQRRSMLETPTPKWKRRVNLPSHSNLF